MSKILYKNGWIIKAYFEEKSKIHNPMYFGIQHGMTWPLDTHSDKESKLLSEEAADKWFGYQDFRPWCIPDVGYILRYIKHCYALDLCITCFQIESSNSLIIANGDLPICDILGYEYVDLDMNTSCLYDDLMCLKDSSSEVYGNLQKQLNRYGLFDTEDELNTYIKMRDSIRGLNPEEYYSPLGICLKVVDMNELVK